MLSQLVADSYFEYDPVPAGEEDDASPMWLDHVAEIVPSLHRTRVRWGILGLDPAYDTRLNEILWTGRAPRSVGFFALFMITILQE